MPRRSVWKIVEEGILAFHRLNVPATLNVTFLSTNHIENVMRNTRGTLGKVCRWNQQTDQLTRWMGVALLWAQEGFRRVRGHKELGDLAAALGSAGSAASSLRSSSAPPALPSAGDHSELAGEIGFSYHGENRLELAGGYSSLSTNPELERNAMSVVEKLIAQGRVEGISQGRSEGRSEGLCIGKIQAFEEFLEKPQTSREFLEAMPLAELEVLHQKLHQECELRFKRS